jgi:hypothetical protein
MILSGFGKMANSSHRVLGRNILRLATFRRSEMNLTETSHEADKLRKQVSTLATFGKCALQVDRWRPPSGGKPGSCPMQ